MSKKVSIILSIFLAGIIALWIWSFAAPKNFVILGGSTSVNPFMQLYTSEYQRKNDRDFIFNSTGSQAGVTGVENQMYGAGFISKNATPDMTLSTGNSFFDFQSEEGDITFENGEGNEFHNTLMDVVKQDRLEARNSSYISFNFAIDAILLIYNPPTWFLDEGLDKKLDFQLDKNNADNTTLGRIYANDFSWEQLAQQLDGKQRSGRTVFHTFTREDGSGTRSAFGDITGVRRMPTANVVNSNGGMLENISRSTGSIGFISYAFLKQIDGSTPVRVAGIDGWRLGNLADNSENFAMKLNTQTNSFEITEMKNEDIIRKGDYEFQRPFIAIFNLHFERIELLVNFFAAMIGIDEQPQWVSDTFEREGLISHFVVKHLQNETNV